MKLKEAFDRLKFTISKQNKPNEKDIEAFNKLAEYAIMKDGIEPIKQNKETNSLKIENFKEISMISMNENIQNL